MTATTVLMSGPMRKRFGRSFNVHLDTKSPREAFRALAATVPGFRAYLLGARSRGIEFAVWRGQGANAENIGVEQLDEPAGAVVRIAPIHKGSKQAGVLQTILGVVLIVVGAFTSWSGGGYLIATGISLVAGGVVQMLTPIPKLKKSADSSDNQASYVFNGATNTTAQGNCVPVVYGRIRAGSAVISAGMSAEDYVPAVGGVGPGTPGGGNLKSPYDTLE